MVFEILGIEFFLFVLSLLIFLKMFREGVFMLGF